MVFNFTDQIIFDTESIYKKKNFKDYQILFPMDSSKKRLWDEKSNFPQQFIFACIFMENSIITVNLNARAWHHMRINNILGWGWNKNENMFT